MLKELIPYVDAQVSRRTGPPESRDGGTLRGRRRNLQHRAETPRPVQRRSGCSAPPAVVAPISRPAIRSSPPMRRRRTLASTCFWIGCGTEDPLIKGAKTFDAELTRLQITHTYAERAGGHVWPIWRWALSEFAPQLFRKR